MNGILNGSTLLHESEGSATVPVAFLKPRSNLLTIIEAGAAGGGAGALAHDIYVDRSENVN
jgi:hypothetical protein